VADPHDSSHEPHGDPHKGPHDEPFFGAEHHEGEHHEGTHLDIDMAHEGEQPSEFGLQSAHDLHASSEDFDFTEPSEFAFPGGHEGSTDSGLFEPQVHDSAAHESLSAEGEFGEHGAEAGHFGEGHFDVGQFGADHPGATTTMPDFGAESFHAGGGVAEAVAGEEAVAVAEEAVEEPEPKKRRELPAWVHTTEWALIGLIPLAAVVLNIVAIKNWQPKNINLAWHISYVLLLLLIPYALWRSKNRWLTPRITASYTVMLAVATGCLLTGVWLLGNELSNCGWQIKVKKVRIPSPLPVTSMMEPKQGGVCDLQCEGSHSLS
jgi:hypothetical protein